MYSQIGPVAIVLISINLCYFIVDGKFSCKDIENNSKELQLKNYLFCDYDPIVRPSSGNNKTLVKIYINAQFIEFDDFTNIFTLHSMTNILWTDPYLVWNPEDYDGIKNIRISRSDIWAPDLTVLNSDNNGVNVLGSSKTKCIVKHNGVVQCIPSTIYAAHCNSNYEMYPYDVHNCTFQIASRSYHSEDISFNTDTDSFVLNDNRDISQWSVIKQGIAFKYEIFDFQKTDTQKTHVCELAYLIQRTSEMRVTFVGPAFAFAVINLFILWLDCHSNERMILICLSFICHLIAIHVLYEWVPFNGGSLPKMLRLYESSFILTTFALILTMLMRELRRLRNSPPEWINTIATLTLQSKIGQILLISILDPKASAFMELSAEDKHKDRKINSWSHFVLIIGWLAFISTLLTYLVLLGLYLPALRLENSAK